MNLRKTLLSLTALLATSALAQAGDVTVRNKTVHEPDVLWVAEYSVGASKAERVKGPWKIKPEDKQKWSKSKFKSFHERWIRWSPKENNLKKTFSKSGNHFASRMTSRK